MYLCLLLVVNVGISLYPGCLVSGMVGIRDVWYDSHHVYHSLSNGGWLRRKVVQHVPFTVIVYLHVFW